MKYFTYLIILLMIAASGCRSSKPLSGTSTDKKEDMASAIKTETDFSKQETWLLGYFNPSMLKKEPYASWFYKGYDSYMFKSDVMNTLMDIPKDDITIKVIMGTWCPDSRREVPRFMKILDTWQFPAEKITFIGVDNSKQSPIGGFEEYHIERVPTFIFYKNNIEAGRIIEVPKTSLEQDMVNILTKE
jgi:thiol-disulfide isomerase/thioredoxin